jgi:putative ABC transport system ATP-binding protein
VTTVSSAAVPADELRLSELTIEYSSGGYAVRPIAGLNLDVQSGSMVLLLGASGCGKTTLLSAMAAILQPTSGTITLGDTDVTALSGRALSDYRLRKVGVIFQSFNLLPSLSALENVMVPMRLAKVPTRDAKARATELLESVDLSDRIAHKPNDMSGGQQQRVAIARALAMEPSLVLADEPTAHLDYVQVESVIKLLRTLAQPGRIVVISTHDDRLLPLADKVVELTPHAAGREGPPETVDLAPGEVLFRQGDRGDRVYVVDSGRIELVRELADGGEEPFAAVMPGSYFGELAPTFGMPRTATARACTHVVLTSYSVRDFRQLMPAPGNSPAREPIGAARTAIAEPLIAGEAPST